jgi:hypothetical protein
MTSAGMGSLAKTSGCELPRFMLGRRDNGAGAARAAAGGRDGGQLLRGPMPGVTACPAARRGRFGLRRSGRPGNGQGPCGRTAPACQPRHPVHPDVRARQRAQGLPAPRGARRAPRALSRPGARCRGCSRPVSPDRSPSEVGRRRGARGAGPFPSSSSRTVRDSFPSHRSPVIFDGRGGPARVDVVVAAAAGDQGLAPPHGH